MSSAFEFESSVHCPGEIVPPSGVGWFYVSSNSVTIQKMDGEISTFITIVWARTQLPIEVRDNASNG